MPTPSTAARPAKQEIVPAQPQMLAPAGDSDEMYAVVEKIAIIGDMGALRPEDRVRYYAQLCHSLGLNPLTRPFEYISLEGKLTLYAKRDAAEQLRVKRRVSVDRIERRLDEASSLYHVLCYGHDGTGRTDQAEGIVNVAGLKGEALANAYMKGETKAKRRFTLSICGLGMLDETEIADTQGAVIVTVDPDTGEVTEVTEGGLAEVRARSAARRGRIAARRLTGGNEQPTTGETGEGRVSASPSRTPAAAGRVAEGARSSGDPSAATTACPHPERQHVVKPEGVVCGACGELLAARDTEQPAARAEAGSAATPPARGRGRSARSDRDEAEQPPSDEAATAKAKAGTFAVASKRGIDHDGIHRLAAVTFTEPADRDQFSCSALVEAEWTALREAFERAPIGKSPEAVYPWVGQTAGRALGLPPDVLDDSKKLWTDNLDPLATALMGEPAGELSGAQWILFALLTEAGERPVAPSAVGGTDG